MSRRWREASMRWMVFVVAAWWLLSGAAAGATAWDLASNAGKNSIRAQVARAFAEAVEGATGGEIAITVHSGGVKLRGSEIVRAVERGELALGERPMASFAEDYPVFGIHAVRFLGGDFGAARRLDRASRSAIAAHLDSRGLRLLYTVPVMPIGLYANREIASNADFRGVRMRVDNTAAAKFAQLAGAFPVGVPDKSLVDAIARGTVDAVWLSTAVGVEEKLWTTFDHYYRIESWLPKNFVFINAAMFDALPPEQQGIILGAAAMAETMGWNRSRLRATGFARRLAAEGMVVDDPSTVWRAELRNIGAAMLMDWLKVAGIAGAAVLDSFNEISAAP
jgi:TRAP-type C4-dicarboxylate transport system substrate-binding protein